MTDNTPNEFPLDFTFSVITLTRPRVHHDSDHTIHVYFFYFYGLCQEFSFSSEHALAYRSPVAYRPMWQ